MSRNPKPAWRNCVSFYFWVMELVIVIILVLVGYLATTQATVRHINNFKLWDRNIHIRRSYRLELKLNEYRFDCILPAWNI